MATRGHLGGLARATGDAALVLDAAGTDVIVIETVGVGQDEVDIIRTADVSIVTLVPGTGDEVQALKAGIMEIADIFVVNKADRDGADRVVQEILQMLELGEHGAWIPPVLKTVARTGQGVPELREALEKHRVFLAGEEGAARRRVRTRGRIEAIVRERLLSELRSLSGSERSLDAHAERVEAREEDPVAAAESLLAAVRARRATDAMVKRIAHLGIAVPRIEDASFYDVLGLLEAHREEVASQGVVTSFRPIGESFVELLEPTSSDSPIAKFLAKRGPGLHHVCLEVRDVRAALRVLKDAGVRLVNEEPFAGAHGCLVAFVHPSSAGGVLFELSEKLS